MDELLRSIDLMTPWAIRAAATLRLPDAIADGCNDVAELAVKLGVEREPLARLLRFLANIGVCREIAAHSFELGEMGTLLLDDHPSGIRAWLDLDGWGGRQDRAYEGILETIRSGRPAFETVYGRPLWEELAADPRMTESFNAVMATQARTVAPELVALFDWASVDHVVDVGGGTGTILRSLLEAHPHLRGTLVDRPATAKEAQRALAELGSRCSFAGQSFFDPLPPADVYLLTFVITDWSDATAAALLARCAEALAEDGSVVIFERIADDAAATGSRDLCMLALTGGKERTAAELDAVLDVAGLKVAARRRSPSGRVLTECRRAAPGMPARG
jgi:hypothetical protein